MIGGNAQPEQVKLDAADRGAAAAAHVQVPTRTSAGSDADILLPPGTWHFAVKHALDWLTALVLLVLTAPLVLAAMCLVKLTSRGPALYSQTRLGRGGRPFAIFKLRTMYDECESLTGACWSKPGDSRITPLGRWLRKTHLDELPQLWNVLRGDMSIIGPRPERPEFVPTLEQAVPYYRDRLLVRPGITGLAQVQLPPDTDLDSVRVKTAYDLHYVRSASLGLDVRVGLATALKMLGVRFGLLRSLCCFPVREAIEQSYRALVANGRRLPRGEGARPKSGPVLRIIGS